MCVSVTHPFTGTGEFVGVGPDAPFKVVRPYFGRRPFEATARRDGVTMSFRGGAYPLEDYAIAIERSGLVVELLREPEPCGSKTRDRTVPDVPFPSGVETGDGLPDYGRASFMTKV